MQASPGKAHIAVTHNKSLACDVNTLIDAYTPPIPPHSGEGGGGGGGGGGDVTHDRNRYSHK